MVLIFFLPALLGADCDPNQTVRTRFDHEYETVRRDNLRASGTYYDEHDQLPNADHTGVMFLASPHGVDTELLFEYEGHGLYSFYQPPDALPLRLKPAPDENFLTLLLRSDTNEVLDTYMAPVYMHSDVIVLPVYTWTLRNQEMPASMEDELGSYMRFTFDRGESSSTSLLPANVWEPLGGQRIDSIWTQCDIQFRFMENRYIDVPICYTSGVEPYGPSGLHEECTACPASSQDCPKYDDEESCSCSNLGQKCSLGVFLEKGGYYVPNAINIYFVRSFSASNPDYYGLMGIACTADDDFLNTGRKLPWIFIPWFNLSNDTYRTVLAHEIGHTLAENSDHLAGTLMEQGDHPNVTLTAEQCQVARAQQTVVLDSRL